MPGSFLDGNVLLYAVSADAARADRAERLLVGGGTVSVRVLNEVADVLRRKVRADRMRTRTVLARFRAVLAVVPVTVETHKAGLSWPSGTASRSGTRCSPPRRWTPAATRCGPRACGTGCRSPAGCGCATRSASAPPDPLAPGAPFR